MLPPLQKPSMSKRIAEKREQQRAFHERVRSGVISAQDAVKSASFFPANQKPRLVSRLCF